MKIRITILCLFLPVLAVLTFIIQNTGIDPVKFLRDCVIFLQDSVIFLQDSVIFLLWLVKWPLILLASGYMGYLISRVHKKISMRPTTSATICGVVSAVACFYLVYNSYQWATLMALAFTFFAFHLDPPKEFEDMLMFLAIFVVLTFSLNAAYKLDSETSKAFYDYDMTSEEQQQADVILGKGAVKNELGNWLFNQALFSPNITPNTNQLTLKVDDRTTLVCQKIDGELYTNTENWENSLLARRVCVKRQNEY